MIVPDTGSGYGGKHEGDAAAEAAVLAKAVGKPVKRNWTREEEMTWAYFRPGGVIEAGGKADKDGTLTAWEFHNYNSGPSGLKRHTRWRRRRSRCTRANRRCGRVRTAAWPRPRTISCARCYMDEIAHSIGMDPLEFRLKNAKDERLRAVIEEAAAKFDWADARRRRDTASVSPPGSRRAATSRRAPRSRVTNGQVKVLRVVEAFECGAIVNPEHLRNQVEGAISMGIGGALFEHIDFAGRQDQDQPAFEVPRAALQRHAGDRERAARP